MMNNCVWPAFALAGMLVWTLPSASASAQPASPGDEEPRAIVDQLYKISAGKDGKYSGKSAFDQPAVRKRWFTKSLSAALDAMDRKSKRLNEPILDFDPVTNSQDPDVKRLTLTDETATSLKSVVRATFYAFDEPLPLNVRYIFVREGKSWKLDDMSGDRGGQDKWVLRAVIK